MSEIVHIAPEESATAIVIEAVAEVTGRDASELPTLYRVVDPDALNRLVEGPQTGRESNVTVSFAMAGCRVEVTDAGVVTVEQTERLDARPDAALADGGRRESGAVEPVGDSGAVESPDGELAFERSR